MAGTGSFIPFQVLVILPIGLGLFFFLTHTSLFQSLDYDRCINDPYLEVLETMDNKVSPLLISWDQVGLRTASFSVLNSQVNFFTPWPLNPFHEISAFIT